MNADLGLTGTQFNLAATMFFIPYALFEIPSNIVLKMMRPSRWMACLVISWGIVRATLAVQSVLPSLISD